MSGFLSIIEYHDTSKAALTALAVNVRHAGRDEPPRLEPALALGDLDGADVSRPCVDVLEQVAVDRFQVVEVEIARRHGLKEAQGDKLAFRRFQRRASRMSSLLRRTV